MVRSRMRRYRKVFFAVLVTLCAAALASCASEGIGVFKLTPVKGQAATVSVHNGQVTLSARYLDAGQRMTYLQDLGYEPLGLGLRQVSLVTFLVNVRNNSTGELLMDPGSIRLAVGMGPLLSPYNYAHLYMELPRGSDRQRILGDLKEAVYDKSTTIPPGRTMEKLLLFKRPEKVGPEAALLFQRLYVGGQETQAVLDFVAVDLER